ncbi:hypothetical protein AKJ16_DCAP18820 [Drosera capensis]
MGSTHRDEQLAGKVTSWIVCDVPVSLDGCMEVQTRMVIMRGEDLVIFPWFWNGTFGASGMDERVKRDGELDTRKATTRFEVDNDDWFEK